MRRSWQPFSQSHVAPYYHTFHPGALWYDGLLSTCCFCELWLRFRVRFKVLFHPSLASSLSSHLLVRVQPRTTQGRTWTFQTVFAIVQLATFGMFKQMQFCLEICAFVHTLIWTLKMWSHFVVNMSRLFSTERLCKKDFGPGPQLWPLSACERL